MGYTLYILARTQVKEMEKIVIVKERNTLTIEVNGNTWTVTNALTSGKLAGKTMTSTEECPTHRTACNAAKRHAKVNGWDIKEAQAAGWNKKA